ncbi:MAG TPA: 3'-5' exonuclease [Bdellovibrionota bacterium]|nr:3'-5' exonuclease [Bdellovibrionota bacterium]
MKLSEMSFVVVDLETTGLYPDRGSEIIEVGAVKISENCVTEETFQTFVKPKKELPEEIKSITGITEKDLIQAPSIEAVLPQFLNFIGSKLLIAQNAKFDLSFIVAAIKQLNFQPFTNNFVDTMLISRLLFFYEKEHNLDAIAQRLGIDVNFERHRSVGDCKLTGLAFLKMVELLAHKGKDNLKAIQSCILNPYNWAQTQTKKPSPTPGLF